ncbi:hypothetical protein ACMFMG_009031 [Clarireedia jacksonii]
MINVQCCRLSRMSNNMNNFESNIKVDYAPSQSGPRCFCESETLPPLVLCCDTTTASAIYFYRPGVRDFCVSVYDLAIHNKLNNPSMDQGTIDEVTLHPKHVVSYWFCGIAIGTGLLIKLFSIWLAWIKYGNLDRDPTEYWPRC